MAQREEAGSIPTIEDVARQAGVSRSAVSKVIRDAYGISDDMRARVNRAIEELNYRPRLAARTMRGSSRTIGFQMPEVGNEFLTTILEAAFEVFERSRFQPIIAPFQGISRINNALTSLVDRQVDGIVAISPFMTTDFLDTLGRSVPLVTIGRHDDAPAYDTVVGDDALGGQLVMDHLAALGHSRIAHLTLEKHLVDRSGNDGHAIRLAAYVRAMESRGLDTSIARSGGTERSGAEATRRLLSAAQPPTAIFAAHDALAIGALRAVCELGLSSRQVSIVGYDNTPIASHPLIGLTSVDQFGADLGRMAATLLLERIEGRSEPAHARTKPVLRERSSSTRVDQASPLPKRGTDQ